MTASGLLLASPKQPGCAKAGRVKMQQKSDVTLHYVNVNVNLRRARFSGLFVVKECAFRGAISFLRRYMPGNSGHLFKAVQALDATSQSNLLKT
ncbi:hypothetical protein [Noviherbaspirillum agri]